MRFSVFPVIDMNATGANILRLRQAAGLTVRQMQDAFGFSTPQAIYKWQRGEALPTLENMTILARLFRQPMERILVFVPGYADPGDASMERK